MTTPTTVQVRLQIRADTAANWASVNPVLLTNELGLESDTKKFKVGNGSSTWNSLAYFPSIVSGGTVLGNLEIGTTGTLTFEGSTANAFETTLGVVDPTADRTILLPNQSGTVVVGGNASITDADIAANAEIAVSKLADGAARQLLQTDAAGTGVEWTDNVDVPGTLDVTGTGTFDGNVTIAGDLTVNGTTTTINTQDLLVEDKNIIIGNVTTPSDVTADGGGITLKGTTDKTINWVDSTDAWTLSEHVDLGSGKEYRIAGSKVLDGTSLGSAVVSSSLTSLGTVTTGVWNGTTVATGYGGTGQTAYTDGELLIGKTDGTLAKTTLTAGSNVTITNGDGSISIASTDTNTTYTAGDGLILAGTEFSADLKANGGIVVETNELAVDLGATNITGTLAASDGGTGQTTYTDGQLLIGKTDGTLAKTTLTAGSNVTITNGDGSISIASTDTNTTYTAGDGLDLVGTEFSADLKANGGIVIETGELAVDLGAASITGTLATGDGGTGQTTYSDGQLLIGKTDGTLAKATITQGSGVTITNGDGAITIAATGSGGTITAVTATSPLASTGGTTPDISIQDGTTTQKGAVQLEDSTSSTSTTKAATPNSVKSAYDLANAALPKSGGTMTGDITFAGTQTFPGTLVSGDIGVTVQGYDADTAKYDDTTANFTGTLQNGGSNVVVDSDIGVTVQGYDADTAKLDVAQTFTAAQTIAADLTLNGQSDLRFADSDSSNWVAFQAPATIAADVTWTLPDADGTTGQALTTNGSGVLSWATAGGGSGFTSGTAMLFVQTSAPTGWTKSTTHNDKALRVVSGSASSGGSTAFTTVFASRTPSGTVGSTTLTTSQMPSHTHGIAYGSGTTSYNSRLSQANSAVGTYTSNSTGGGNSHDHSFSGSAMDFAVQYVDVIIATKD